MISLFSSPGFLCFSTETEVCGHHKGSRDLRTSLERRGSVMMQPQDRKLLLPGRGSAIPSTSFSQHCDFPGHCSQANPVTLLQGVCPRQHVQWLHRRRGRANPHHPSGRASIAVPISWVKKPMLRAAEGLAPNCTTRSGQSWDDNSSHPILRVQVFLEHPTISNSWPGSQKLPVWLRLWVAGGLSKPCSLQKDSITRNQG